MGARYPYARTTPRAGNAAGAESDQVARVGTGPFRGIIEADGEPRSSSSALHRFAITASRRDGLSMRASSQNKSSRRSGFTGSPFSQHVANRDADSPGYAESRAQAAFRNGSYIDIGQRPRERKECLKRPRGAGRRRYRAACACAMASCASSSLRSRSRSRSMAQLRKYTTQFAAMQTTLRKYTASTQLMVPDTNFAAMPAK